MKLQMETSVKSQITEGIVQQPTLPINYRVCDTHFFSVNLLDFRFANIPNGYVVPTRVNYKEWRLTEIDNTNLKLYIVMAHAPRIIYVTEDAISERGRCRRGGELAE